MPGLLNARMGRQSLFHSRRKANLPQALLAERVRRERREPSTTVRDSVLVRGGEALIFHLHKHERSTTLRIKWTTGANTVVGTVRTRVIHAF